MRLPLPTRFEPRYATIFIAFVFVGQLLCGTNIFFCLLTAVYIAIWATGFNISGGLVYPSGAFIFFNGMLTAIFGLVVKIFLFERGEKNLLAPLRTMIIYCLGMLGMSLAALVCRGLRPKQGLLKNFATLTDMKRAAIVCLSIGYLPELFGASRNAGSLFSALAQLNSFPMMAVLLATTYQIKHSEGKSSVNWIVLAASAPAFGLAIVNFGKAGMLVGFTAWVISAAMLRYNFSRVQVFGCIVAFSFFNYYLVPYSQLVRIYRAPTAAENIVLATHYLGDLNATRAEYLETLDDQDLTDDWHLFDHREPFLERLIILAPDDYLINFTNHDHVVGLSPTTNAYLNIIPHFIWKDKPMFNAGNDFAHELGILGEDDDTTGVSFSAGAELYHQATWLGVVLVWPLIIFLFFIITDSLTGSAADAPWALLPILALAQIANGGGVAGTVFLTTDGTLGLLLIYTTLKHVAPFLTNSFRRSKMNPGTPTPPSLTPALGPGLS